MKSRYILPSLFLVGLTACGQQMSSSGQSVETVQAGPVASQKTLGGQNDEVTAEEIQQRREVWVGADDGVSKAASRVASAEAPSRD